MSGPTAPVVLCVEDDAPLTPGLRAALEHAGYHVQVARTQRDALQSVRTAPPDLILLDLARPDDDGAAFCRRLHATVRVPVILLTARHTDQDVLSGFASGADDYITKPCALPILLARIAAVLRRGGTAGRTVGSGELWALGAGTYDATRQLITAGGRTVQLTSREGQILLLLLAHEGRVVSASRILERVWGHNTESQESVVKTHIHHLRRKLEQALPGTVLVHTVPRIGYMVRRPEGAASTSFPEAEGGAGPDSPPAGDSGE